LIDQLKKEKKTREDWEEIEKSYGEFLEDNPTAMSFNDFMQLS
jgi:hypothetical protein